MYLHFARTQKISSHSLTCWRIYTCVCTHMALNCALYYILCICIYLFHYFGTRSRWIVQNSLSRAICFCFDFIFAFFVWPHGFRVTYCHFLCGRLLDTYLLPSKTFPWLYKYLHTFVSVLHKLAVIFESAKRY